jgi:hypothetical protein
MKDVTRVLDTRITLCCSVRQRSLQIQAGANTSQLISILRFQRPMFGEIQHCNFETLKA